MAGSAARRPLKTASWRQTPRMIAGRQIAATMKASRTALVDLHLGPTRAFVAQCVLVSIPLLGFILASKFFSLGGFPHAHAVNPLYAVLRPVVPNLFSLISFVVLALFVLFIRRALATRTSPLLILLLLTLFSLGLNLSVAMVRGPEAVAAPFMRPQEYYSEVAQVNNPVSFIADYPLLSKSFVSIHGRVHPPGPILLLWLVSRLATGTLTAALAVIVIGSLAVVPVYLLIREMFPGQKTTVVCSAFYLLTPSIIMFTATSMNAVFSFLAAWLFYFTVKLIRSEFSLRCSLALGIILTISAFFTFDQVFAFLFCGLAALFFLLSMRNWAKLVNVMLIPVVFVVLNLALYVFTGYNLIEVIRSTFGYYREDVAEMVKTYGSQSVSTPYWLLGNPVAFLIFLGLPTLLLLVKGIPEFLRSVRGDLAIKAVAFASLATLLAVNVPGLYKGEVERIWMYLVPLAIILVARAASSLPSVTLYVALLALGSQTFLLEHALYTFW